MRAYAASSPAAPYRARAWHPAPGRLARVPLEPLLRLAACVGGANGELWLGHGGAWRTLTRPDGYLWIAHLAEWQHVAMYAAFALGAVVDVAAFYAPPGTFPAGASHAAMVGAFALEAGLFGFHLEGTAFDVRAHALLTWLVAACAALTAAEAAWPASPALGVARAHATAMQGAWFVVLARALFEGRRAWDPRYHGGYMALPALAAAIAVAFGAVCVAAFGVAACWRRRGVAYGAVCTDDDGDGGGRTIKAELGLVRLA